jgi:rare lipoprotein A
MRSRIATTLVLAAALALPAGALAQDPGGSGTSDSGGAAFTAPPVAPLTPGGLLRGTVRWSGTLPAGGPVRVEQLDPATGAWNAVAHTTADSNGAFTASWPAGVLGAATVRAVPDGDGATASEAPLTATVTTFRGARATWYGPGFFGHRLACGGKLTSTTLGVAHRTLPCGTPVQVFYRGRSLTVPVVDRGPFANGASYDLTAATARALGFKETSRIGVLPQPVAGTAKRHS